MKPLYVCPCNATCKETLQVANLRPRIEAILWKAYEPNQSPNMEEVTDQILSLISKHYVSKEKVREEIEKMKKAQLENYSRSIKSPMWGIEYPEMKKFLDYFNRGYDHAIDDLCYALLPEESKK